MPAKGRDHNPSGLGRAIINRKVKDARRMQESGNYTTDISSTERLKSVTQERDLDEFLSTAQLAGTDFTAERRNVKIIQNTPGRTVNPYLLSEEEERSTLQKHLDNKEKLRVPRRPPWKKSLTPAELDRQEKAAFLEWRRGLAQLQDQDKLILTPFERNLEVWRQLWRVLERSHLVVQIVDARNPLRFRCEDLDNYVSDVEGPEGEHGSGPGKRKSLLLVNKADLLTSSQRREWADYFDENHIRFAFFSAANAAAIQQARRDALEQAQLAAGAAGVTSEEHDDEAPTPPLSEDGNSESEGEIEESDGSEDHHIPLSEQPEENQDPRARVLSVLELEDLFTKMAPPLTDFTDSTGKVPTKLVVGLVGYPNVGKSSTINALLGEKKVSVSSTPGKTKHFQTIHLSDSIVLCDCPGLVFPQFATTKADLVCDGVLPIDQLREHTGPTALVVKRIPKDVIEATYGLTIKTKSIEEGGDDTVRPEDLLIPYAVARGFTRSGQGNPDEARAARYILKDYVNGKLLYAQPPPGVPDSTFNQKMHENSLSRAMGKKHAPLTRVGKGADTFIPSNIEDRITVEGSILPATGTGHKSKAIDKEFFNSQAGYGSRPMVAGKHRKEFTRVQMYPHQNAVADDGSTLTGHRARLAAVLVNGGDVTSTDKQHRKPKREKKRSGRGYD